jgi:hypothetical protein
VRSAHVGCVRRKDLDRARVRDHRHAVSIYLWRRSQVRKAISHRLTAPAVVSVHHEVADRISVLYDGQRFKDVRLLTLRIANMGNGDIKPEDFEGPFTVTLGEGARVLGDPEVVATTPSDLEPQVSVKDGELVIAPLLLNGSPSWRRNEGDSFEVTALVSDLASPRLRARIAGVPRLINDATAETGVTRTSVMRFTPALAAAVTFLIAVAGAVTGTIAWVNDARRSAKTHSIVTLATGRTLCGEVLRVDSTAIVLKLKQTGALLELPIKGTRIKNDAC